MKLGKKPARRGAIRLKFRNYVNLSVLPTPPVTWGHDALVTQPWSMLGNSDWGDCVEAGAAHETMLWNAEAGATVTFSDTSVLSDYSATTGFDPADPSTDQGTDMQSYAAYRKNIGVLDADGKRHRVGAYLELTPGDLQEQLTAAYIFGIVGVGLEFPQSAMDQFNAGQPWSLVTGSPIIGGHYIPLVARRSKSVVVTWGQEQLMADDFFTTYNDESVVYLSPEFLKGGISLEGFDLAQLNTDLLALGSPQTLSVGVPMTAPLVFLDATGAPVKGPAGKMSVSNPSVKASLSADGQAINATMTAPSTTATLTWNGPKFSLSSTIKTA